MVQNDLGIYFDLDRTLLNRDVPEIDVRAAQNVGIKGIWKKDFQMNHVEVDFIVDDLAKYL